MTIRHRFGLFLVGTALLGGSAYSIVTSDTFVKRMVRSLLAQTVRGPATVESASFSFLHGLTLTGLEVRDPSDPLGRPALRVDRLRADYLLFGTGGKPRVTAVSLEGPEIHVRRDGEGRFSFASLLAPLPDDGTAAPPPIKVTGARLIYDDAVILRGEPFVIDRVNGELRPSVEEGAWAASLEGDTSFVGKLSATASLRKDGSYEYQVHLPAVLLNDALLGHVNLPAAEAARSFHPHGFIGVTMRGALNPGAAAPPEVDIVLNDEDLVLAAGGESPVAVKVDGGRLLLRGDRIVVENLHGTALGAKWTATGEVFDLGASPTLAIDATLDDLAIEERNFAQLPRVARGIIDAYGIRGMVHARLHASGAATHPVVRVDAAVTKGTVRYDGWLRSDGRRHGFPWQVDDVSAKVSFDGKRMLRLEANGRHGPATVHGTGAIDFAHGDEVPEISIEATNVPLDGSLQVALARAAGGVGTGNLFTRWSPSGVAKSIQVRVIRDPHADGPFGAATEIVLEFDGRAAFVPDVFPAALSGVSGRVEVLAPSAGDERGELVRLREIRGTAEGLSIMVDGTVATADGIADEELRVEADVSDLAGAFGAALLDERSRVPASVKDVYRGFRPSGPATIRARLAGGGDTGGGEHGGGTARGDRVTIGLRGAAIGTLRVIPAGLSALQGDIVVDGDVASFERIEGQILDTTFVGSGSIASLSHGPQISLSITAPHVPLGPPLRTALGDLASRAAALWDTLDPVGGEGVEGTRANVDLTIRPDGSPTPLEVTLRDVTGPLRPLGLEFDCAGGTLHYDGRKAEARGLHASIGGAEIEIASADYDIASGNLMAKASMLGLHFPEDIESLLGEDTAAKISDAMPSRNIHGNDLAITWDAAERTLYWAGKVSVRPRSRRAVPDPGFAPDGTLDVATFRVAVPAGGGTEFSSQMRTTGFKLNAGLQIDDLSASFTLDGRTEDGSFGIGVASDDATLRVGGFLFEDAQLVARSSPKGASLEVRRAGFGGGTFTARLGPGGPNVKYAGEMHLIGGDLRKIAGEKGDTSGRVTADVWFRNTTGSAETLSGSVGLDVKDGDLGKFPVISALLNIFPGAGNLTAGSLQGDLAGRRVKIRDCVVTGPALSLTNGRGSVTLDGDLDVYLTPSLLIPFLGQILPVHIGGTLRNPNPEVRPFGGAAEQKDTPAPKPTGDIDDLPSHAW